MTEIWRDILVNGIKTNYEVSNIGRIRSFGFRYMIMNGAKSYYKPSKILTEKTNRDGYKSVAISINKKPFTMLVHRALAQAFIPNPDGLPQINHKDEVKDNNLLSNLEWCTVSYNINYGTCIARRVAKAINHPGLSTKVSQYDLDGNFLKSYPSIAEAVRNGFNSGNVSSVCSGRKKTSGGYIWKYT